MERENSDDRKETPEHRFRDNIKFACLFVAQFHGSYYRKKPRRSKIFNCFQNDLTVGVISHTLIVEYFVNETS